MSFVTNEWIPHEAYPDTTILRISGVYTVDVLVSTQDLPKLQPYSWCYEQAKGNVYMMDNTMELARTLGVTSPRVYLWKLVVYLHTERIAKSWRRINRDDYRFNHGTIEYINPVPVETIADR